jgi:hypothetical protein
MICPMSGNLSIKTKKAYWQRYWSTTRAYSISFYSIIYDYHTWHFCSLLLSRT